MANQASTSKADSLEEKIKDCHNEMVIRLCDYFSPKLKDKWKVLLQRLTKYLKPVDLYADDNSFIDICNRLMALEIIDYGSYDKLYEVIKKSDAEPAKIIKETSEEIKDIRSKVAEAAAQNQDNSEALDDKIKTRHSEMVNDLALHVYRNALCWEPFKQMLSTFLKPADLGKDDLRYYVAKLIDDEVIKYGEYAKLKNILQQVHKLASRIIEKAESDIKALKDGSSMVDG